MLKIYRKKTILFTFVVILFIITTNVSLAGTVFYNNPPIDSDFDGLTDQGEIQIFGTNPNNPDTDNDGYLDGAEILSNSNPLKKNGVADTIRQNDITPKKTPWTWFVIRSSGLTGYMLLFLLIVSGIGIKTALSYKFISPENAWTTHKLLGISLSVTIATHLISILSDSFLQFSLVDIFIPFATDFRSIYVGLGIIGFYIFLGIIITSLFYFTKAPKLWRLLHYLTYPTFILLFLHGVYTGTDTGLWFIQLMYWVTGLTVLVLTSYRISLKMIK